MLNWTDGSAADELEIPLRTVKDQRQGLENAGYITCIRKWQGQKIIVHNWVNPREYSGEVINPHSDTPLSECDSEQDLHSDTHSDTYSDTHSGIQSVPPTSNPQIKESDNHNHAKERHEGLYLIAVALSEITGMDFSKNKARLFAEAKRFYKIDELEKLKTNYGKEGVWYQTDWRGKRGYPPTLQQIRETWSSLVVEAATDEVDLRLSN